MKEQPALLDKCPDKISIIGGGRWARVLADVTCNLASDTVEITVHSPSNAGEMKAWVVSRGLTERVRVMSAWPELPSNQSNAVIVVNAARDHEKAVEWALSKGASVLVEKPVALSKEAAQRLVNLAADKNARFAASHIFLFATYLDHFSKLVSDAGKIRLLRMQWTDPRFENRYGEQKHYDPSLPIFFDWLPHTLSILSLFSSGAPCASKIIELQKGGSHLEVELSFGDISSRIIMARNSDRRRRILEVNAGDKWFCLDFSEEPGTICWGDTKIVGDPCWGDLNKRPVAQMLTAFLGWAAGGLADKRLSVEVGLNACVAIEQIATPYCSALNSWLVNKIPSLSQIDDDLHYALSELTRS